MPPVDGTFSAKVSMPISRQRGSAIITGLRFGDSLCIFTAVPTGSEDYPAAFREAVRNLCVRIGYRVVIIVDAHNSIGETPSDALQADALEGIKEVASELFSSSQFEFAVGSAGKQFAFASLSKADVGAGGIGCLVLRINGVDYALVSADSNNALVGLREEIKATLAAKSVELIEFCTSDSHFNAARIRNKRGYLVLGETTTSTRIVNDVVELVERAKGDAAKASLEFYEWVCQVNLPKTDLLARMESTLTGTLGATKDGLILIFGLLFVELAAILVL